MVGLMHELTVIHKIRVETYILTTEKLAKLLKK